MKTQRECKSDESIIEEYKKMFGSRISARATEELLGWENSTRNTIAWSHDMEGHVKQCVERYCELANTTIEQLSEVSTPCLDDHQFKKKKWKRLEDCQKFALKSS